MREKDIERALTQAVQNAGGLCWKFTSPSVAGVPDRIIILPGGKIGFIEVKTTGNKPRPIQTHRINQLTNLQVLALTIDHTDQIQGALHAIQTA